MSEKSDYLQKVEAYLQEAQAENKHLQKIRDAAVALRVKRVGKQDHEVYTMQACWSEFEALWAALDAFVEAEKKGVDAAVATK